MDADEQRFDETSVLYLFFFLKKCGELQKPEGHWLLRFVTLLFFAFFLRDSWNMAASKHHNSRSVRFFGSTQWGVCEGKNRLGTPKTHHPFLFTQSNSCLCPYIVPMFKANIRNSYSVLLEKGLREVIFFYVSTQKGFIFSSGDVWSMRGLYLLVSFCGFDHLWPLSLSSLTKRLNNKEQCIAVRMRAPVMSR